jgi:hypothetical protein
MVLQRRKEPIVATSTPSVDIGALAGAIQGEAATRIADMLVVGCDHLNEDGRPLNQIQRCALTRAALRHFDGFEAAVASQLKNDLERAGVRVWGLDNELERMLGGDHA